MQHAVFSASFSAESNKHFIGNERVTCSIHVGRLLNFTSVSPMNRFALVVLLWALLTFSVAAQESTQQRIKIGVVYGFTGAAQVWSEYGRMGLELARDEINSSGGINGKKDRADI